MYRRMKVMIMYALSSVFEDIIDVFQFWDEKEIMALFMTIIVVD